MYSINRCPADFLLFYPIINILSRPLLIPSVTINALLDSIPIEQTLNASTSPLYRKKYAESITLHSKHKSRSPIAGRVARFQTNSFTPDLQGVIWQYAMHELSFLRLIFENGSRCLRRRFISLNPFHG